MRPAVKGALTGLLVFAATTLTTLVATTLATGGEPADRLPPLRPGLAIESPIAASAATYTTTRTDLRLPVAGGSAHAFLVEPDGGAKAGVVLVAGAGSSDREHLLALSERFAAHGIAALRYDKRADGYTPFTRDYTVLADDVLAAARAMRDATGLDRIGALGISEGGWVISDAAARPDSPLAFAVLASAPVVSPGEQPVWIVDRGLQAAPSVIRMTAATAVGQGQYLIDYLTFDTRSHLATIDIPVMAIWDAEDAIVPVNEAYRRLDEGLNDQLTAHIFPGLGHGLRADTDTWLPAVAQWIREPAGTGLTGVEPSSDLGVADLPAPRWHADPRLHLAVAVLTATAAAAATITISRRTKTHEGTPS